MPEMDGLTALRQLKRRCDARIIMVSSLTGEGSHVTLQALNMGAEDFVCKNLSQVSLEIVQIERELLGKVRTLGALRPRPVNTLIGDRREQRIS